MISNTPVIRYDKLQPDEVKEVLLCLLYILKHADEGALIAWWHNASQHDLICFFHILELSLRQFKYLGRKRFGIIGDGNSSKSSTLPPRVPPPVFTSRQSTCYEPNGGIITYLADYFIFEHFHKFILLYRFLFGWRQYLSIFIRVKFDNRGWSDSSRCSRSLLPSFQRGVAERRWG